MPKTEKAPAVSGAPSNHDNCAYVGQHSAINLPLRQQHQDAKQQPESHPKSLRLSQRVELTREIVSLVGAIEAGDLAAKARHDEIWQQLRQDSRVTF